MEKRWIRVFIVLIFFNLLLAQVNESLESEMRKKYSFTYFGAETEETELKEITEKEETQGTETAAGVLENDPDPQREEEYADEKEEEPRENMIGYTLMKNEDGTTVYRKDPDYLLPEELVGRGIYVSEHMCEVEAFLGQKVIAVLKARGKTDEEDRQYFTDWAVQQLEAADWEILGEEWKPDAFAYRRNYQEVNFSGGVKYHFSYLFAPGGESTAGQEVQTVSLSLLIDEDGKVCSAGVEIFDENSDRKSIERSVNETGLYDERYREVIVQSGEVEEGKIMLDFSLWHQLRREKYEPKQEDDAVVRADRIAGILKDILESRGEHTVQYKSHFRSHSDYRRFSDIPWSEIDGNWKTDGKYDCEYIDDIERAGVVQLCFCFYPDFQKMGTGQAKAVIFTCNINEDTDRILDGAYQIFELSREKYEIRDRQKNRQIVDGGEMTGSAVYSFVPVPQTKVQESSLRDYAVDREKNVGVNHVQKELCGNVSRSWMLSDLGRELWKDIDQKNGLAYGCDGEEEASYALKLFWVRAGKNWKVGQEYDCFCIRENERADCVHLRYYFYPQETGQEREWVLALDIYVSEIQVEEIRVNSYVRKRGVVLYEMNGQTADEKQYLWEEAEDGYELTLYDKDGRKVHSQWCPQVSWVSEVAPDVLEIGVSVGSPARYIFFFDRETAEISPVYFNPIIISDKYIAFMEESGVLVLCDLFQRGEVYTEVRRDFSFAADINNTININLLNDRHVEITYSEGEYESEEFKKRKEVITLE